MSYKYIFNPLTGEFDMVRKTTVLPDGSEVSPLPEGGEDGDVILYGPDGAYWGTLTPAMIGAAAAIHTHADMVRFISGYETKLKKLVLSAGDAEKNIITLDNPVTYDGQYLSISPTTSIPCWMTPDKQAVNGSPNLIESGAVYAMIAALINGGSVNVLPTAMLLKYPSRLTYGNVNPVSIEVGFAPVGVMKNVIYISDNKAVSVTPDGTIHVIAPGVSRVHVIPTCNTSLAKTILIEVTYPSIRLASRSQVRLTSSGSLRFN